MGPIVIFVLLFAYVLPIGCAMAIALGLALCLAQWGAR